jgi:pilus assembly protein Flp/PilA
MSIRTAVCRMLRAVSADRGATAVEYALIASLIAVVIVLAVLLLGSNLLDLFDTSASSYADVT